MFWRKEGWINSFQETNQWNQQSTNEWNGINWRIGLFGWLAVISLIEPNQTEDIQFICSIIEASQAN